MPIEFLGANKEETVFSVDGRKIDMPCEARLYDRGQPDALTLCFFPDQTLYRDSRLPVDAALRAALIAYIRREFAASGVRYEIKTEGPA